METQDTATKLSRTRGLRPFKKGHDPRRNLTGRPKTFEHFRAICQRVLGESVELDGETILRAELLARNWAVSREPALQRAVAEYAFGKVPDKLQAEGLENKVTLVLHYAHERHEKLADAPAVNGEGTRRPLLTDAD